jgi:tetratricopeptide (TPR) repeat protein
VTRFRLPPAFLSCLILYSAQLSFAQLPASRDSASDTKEESLRQNASRALNSLGVTYFEKQEFEKAIAAFRDGLKYDPGNRDMRTNLGMVYFQLGQFEKVIETLAEVFKMDQSDQRVLTALAVAHFALGRYGQAAPLYEKLGTLVPNDPILRLTLAVAYRLSDRPADATKLLQRLPQDAQTQAHYHVLLADAHRSQQQLPAAIAEYEQALALVPNLPEVNYRLGVLQSDLHAYEKAVEAFQRELRINPRSADAAYSLGAYFLNYGNDVEKARRYFESTIRFNAGHLGGYLGLMKIHLDLGQPAEALQLAEKAHAIGIENDELHYLKARAFNLQGKKELAEKELKRFEELRADKKTVSP